MLRVSVVMPVIALLLLGACSGGRSLRGSGGATVGTGGGGSGGAMGGSGGSPAGAGGAAGGTGGGPGGTGGTAAGTGGAGGGGGADMSFFVTSQGTGNWGNLGGLAGADARCTSLAMAVSPALGAKTWRAYLSTSTVNARDRIGTGPWRNAKGRNIANSLTQLHDQGAGGQGARVPLDTTWPPNDASVALDERGATVPNIGMGASQLRHEVYTGSNPDGTAGADHCNNWTSAGTGGAGVASGEPSYRALVGYSDRASVTKSWNSVGSAPCNAGPPPPPFGLRGVFYCFAADGTGGAGGAPGGAGGAGGSVSAEMSFFVTSRGKGGGWGNLGGLAGADAFCTSLAGAASPVLGAKTWRAYLSTSTVNARDRIGPGPWRNARGKIIANNVTQLHDQATGGTLDATWPPHNGTIALDENGAMVPGYSTGGSLLSHDVLTGSNPDGTAGNSHCDNWTSAGTGAGGNGGAGVGGMASQALVGYSDRHDGFNGQTTSWNSATVWACGEQGIFAPRGVFYCFAVP